MTERQGVEMDYCPKCRGVWLDRGELQKLIDASIAQLPARPVTTQPAEGGDQVAEQRWRSYQSDHYRPSRPDPIDYADQRPDQRPDQRKPKKRESWLSELFDF